MQISFSTKLFKKAADIAVKSIADKTVKAVLEMVKLSPGGTNEVIIESTNMSTWSSVVCKAEKIEDFTSPFLLPAKVLPEIMKCALGETFTMTDSVDTESTIHGIKFVFGGNEKGQLILPTADADEFPSFPDEAITGPVIRISTEQLLTVFKLTLFSLPKDTTATPLKGLRIGLEGKFITFVSTDGYRLSKVTMEMPIEGLSDSLFVTIPAAAIVELKEISKLCNKDDFLNISFGDSMMSTTITSDVNVTYRTRYLTMEYPALDRVLSYTIGGCLTTDIENLINNIKFISSVDKFSAIRLLLNESEAPELCIKGANIDSGRVDLVSASYAGNTMEIGFSSSLLGEALDRIKTIKGPTDTIDIHFDTVVNKAVILIKLKNIEFTHLLMPVRL